MFSHLEKLSVVRAFLGLLIVLIGSAAQAQVNKNRTVVLSGKIYRSDRQQSLPGAAITIWNAQRKWETKADEKGNYSFGQLKAGKYMVRIHVRYNKISDSPCSICGSRVTADKNSDVTLKDEGLGYVDVWVSIDNFRIAIGKPASKDFDVSCKGTYKNH